MKAERITGNQIDRQEWDAFIAASPQGNFYALSGYMDLIAPGWEALLLRQDKTLVAVMPLQLKRKYGLSYAVQPPFSQHWGVFFAPGEAGAYKAYSRKRKQLKALIAAIPKEIRLFTYGFAPEFDYALPFHWAGYQLRTRYTYRLALDQPEEALLKGMGSDTRYDLRKAADLEAGLRSARDPQHLLRLVEANADAGKPLLNPTEKALLQPVANYLLTAGHGHVLELTDGSGKVIAAGLFAGFGEKTVYLMSALDPAAKATGAMTLLLWKAIRMARENAVVFDFEGSMMEGIEGFFRGFGAAPVPYLHIQKNALPLPLRWIKNLG